ncbi:autophagy-related protein [Anaeramoeba ignava]|uniref:Autophagy-related protein n=1 Tax=Anaeramoeba ignava TaxID=1746090 RepID=A0A9Q0LTC2_ANAIG|nr:autophagy-related protein [Anaeramoeba ignava]
MKSDIIYNELKQQYNIIEKHRQDNPLNFLELKIKFQKLGNQENLKQFQKDMEEIKQAFTIVSSHRDLILHIKNTVSISSSKEELNILQEEVPKLQKQIGVIDKQTELIQTKASKIENFKKTIINYEVDMNSAYIQSMNILSLIDKFSAYSQVKLRVFAQVEEEFAKYYQEAQDIIKELINLVTWYRLFLSAYEQLLREIVRRNQEFKRQLEIVNKCKEEFLLMYETEFRKRQYFYDFYGQYLPQQLCPSIYDFPTMFHIVPEDVENNLPSIELSYDSDNLENVNEINSTQLHHFQQQLQHMQLHSLLTPTPNFFMNQNKSNDQNYQ